jgi:hypothetical protein
MKKSSILILGIIAGVFLVQTLGIGSANTSQDKHLSKEMEQFNAGIEKISKSDRSADEKKMLIDKAQEVKNMMMKINTMEQRNRPITAEEAKDLAELYVAGNNKAIELALALGESVPQNELRHIYTSIVGDPVLKKETKTEPKHWDIPLKKNGKNTATISILADTGKIGSITYH